MFVKVFIYVAKRKLQKKKNNNSAFYFLCVSRLFDCCRVLCTGLHGLGNECWVEYTSRSFDSDFKDTDTSLKKLYIYFLYMLYFQE